MPTYSKLQKVIRDFGLGLQTVNTASDNEQAIRDAYAVEHVEAPDTISFGLTGQDDTGHHNTVYVPRAVAVVTVEPMLTLGGGTSGVQVYFEVSSPTVIKALTRIDTGRYFLACKGLALNDCWGEAHPKVSASAVHRRILVRRKATALTSSTAPGNGFMLYLLERSAVTAKFEAADYSFSFAAFSSTA